MIWMRLNVVAPAPMVTVPVDESANTAISSSAAKSNVAVVVTLVEIVASDIIFTVPYWVVVTPLISI